MGNKKHPNLWDEPLRDPQEYRTGATAPQKNHRGIIAGLLVTVIILGGAVSILGIMNIQLFRQLAMENHETLPFLISTRGQDSEKTHLSPEDRENQTFPGDSMFHATEATGNGTLSEIPPQELLSGDAVHGICGEPVSPFNQNYYQLPQGLYITQVLPDSCAEAAGLRSGDILLSCNGKAAVDLAALEVFFDRCTPGSSVIFAVYRNGKTIYLSFNYSEIDH